MAGMELPFFNLYAIEPKRWNREDARKRATNWCLELQKTDRKWTLLLLGVKVCNAFGIERPEWLEWYRSALWGPMIAVPHPSGLNRWYNDPDNRTAATEVISQVSFGLLPAYDYERVEK